MARGRATSADVAKLAGVSRTTVSVVLTDRQDIHISPATRRRVFDAAERLDYHAHAPARQLRQAPVSLSAWCSANPPSRSPAMPSSARPCVA
ncbi:MAG: LacI family transcriptional regulator [Chloroflexi bacterium]|nr:MAG: LacI family transcriptional regulator [Chloroflexota bacterium]